MRPESEISEDAVLGGALRVRQPLRGHRVGHDAILLAAATGARAGEQATELGSGVGAAGLALAARVDGLRITLVEIDRELCVLAAENARLNRLDDRAKVIEADAEDLTQLATAGFAPGNIDRVLMNPPFHDARRQNVSPDPLRRLAHSGKPGLLVRWIETAAWLLKPHGVLTLIWRADELDDVLDALRPAFGEVAILPVHPRANASAIRILVRAVKTHGNLRRTYAALVLNDDQGRPTAEAEGILRSGKTLEIAEN